MSNGMKFRPPQQQSDSTKQRVVGHLGSKFGQQGESEREQLHERVKRLGQDSERLTNENAADLGPQ